MDSISDPTDPSTITVTAVAPDGCRDRLGYDLIQLVLLAICVTLLPLFSYVAWFTLAMLAHGTSRPVPSVNPSAILLGAVGSWSWMVVGYQRIDRMRMAGKARRLPGEFCFGEFRFDKRLRARDGIGTIRLADGLWTIETSRHRLQFPDSERKIVRSRANWFRTYQVWNVGPYQVRVSASDPTCKKLLV